MQIYLLTRQAIYSKQNWWSYQRAVRLCFKNRLLSSSFVPSELQSLSCRYRCALLSTENCRKKLLVGSRPSRLVRTFLCNFLLELVYSHNAFLQFTNLHGELGTLGSVCREVNCSDIRRITSSASGPRKNVVHVIRKTRVFFVCSCGMDYTACVVHQETEFWINARHCSRSMRIAPVVGFRLKCFAQSKKSTLTWCATAQRPVPGLGPQCCVGCVGSCTPSAHSGVYAVGLHAVGARVGSVDVGLGLALTLRDTSRSIRPPRTLEPRRRLALRCHA